MSDYKSPARPAAGSGFVLNLRATGRVQAMTGTATMVWVGHGLAVISDAINAEYQRLACPHNHISVSVPGESRRATDVEMEVVREAFDMVDAEEDNHSPGVARHLFLPLHLPRGTVGICDCKSDETVVVEPDGYQWSRPKALS